MKKLTKVRRQIIDWNNKFPCDRLWREKHNIPFMSQAHKEISFLDQIFELEEDRLVGELQIKSKVEYIPNIGDFIEIDDKESIIKNMNEEFKKEFLDG